MPTYEYECTECGGPFERLLSISRCDEPQDCECGGRGKKLVSLPNFVLQGDSWPGKANRIQGQMRKKNEVLDRKMGERKRDAPVARLAPNVGGERVDSWADAQKLAASQGRDASTYAPMVAAEQSAKK